jgi:hypothetical protein
MKKRSWIAIFTILFMAVTPWLFGRGGTEREPAVLEQPPSESVEALGTPGDQIEEWAVFRASRHR